MYTEIAAWLSAHPLPQDPCGLLHGSVDSDAPILAAVEHFDVLTADKPSMRFWEQRIQDELAALGSLQVLILLVLLGCKSEDWNGKDYIFKPLHCQSENIMKRASYWFYP